MELSRVLSPDDITSGDDDHDHEYDNDDSKVVTFTVTAPPPPPPPVVRRRVRKPPRLPVATLRDQVKALECALANLKFVLPEAAALSAEAGRRRTCQLITNEDGDDISEKTQEDALRMRTFLRRSLLLEHDRKHQQQRMSELMGLLKRYHESHSALQRLMRGVPISDWECNCDKWGRLAEKRFVPRSTRFWMSMVDTSIEEINAYKHPRSMRQDFFGWNDVILLSDDGCSIEGVSHKTYARSDITNAFESCWGFHLDKDQYKQNLYAGETKLYYKILQQVTDDISIFQTVEQYPGHEEMFHMIAMVFKKKTANGYLLVVKSLTSEELQDTMKLQQHMYTMDSMYWVTWDVTAWDGDGECSEYHACRVGLLGADHPAYATHWLQDVANSLVRIETNVVGVAQLTL